MLSNRKWILQVLAFVLLILMLAIFGFMLFAGSHPPMPQGNTAGIRQASW